LEDNLHLLLKERVELPKKSWEVSHELEF
jgi:hypothetical protein